MNKPITYTIQQILNSQKKLDKLNLLLFMEQLTKWFYFQFDNNKHINFGNIGDFGFKLQENTNRKIPYFFFNQNFISKNHLTQKNRTYVLKPIIKINFSAISKNLPKQIKQQDTIKYITLFINFLETKFKQSNKSLIVIDFDVLGKFIKNDHEVWFEHSLPPKKDILRNTSVRFQVYKEQSKFSNILPLSKLSLLNSQQRFFPKIQKRQAKINHKQKQPPKKEDLVLQKIQILGTPAKNQLLQRRKSSLFKNNKKSEELLQNQSEYNLKRRSISLKDFSKSKFNSLHKPLQFQQKQQKEGNLDWQMLAAGSDPLKKTQSFSKLTTNLKDLMQTKFSFNKQDLNQNIPVIDIFSRTRACPIAAQRQNFLIVGRVGGNYCINSEKIDISIEGIKFTKLKNQILSSTKLNKFMHIIDEQEEYKIILKQEKSKSQIQTLSSLKRSYERYFRLFKMIPDDHIVQIQENSAKNILSKVHFNNQQKNQNIPQQIISQISQNRIHAIKKAIVDYILLDHIQRSRLSVYFKFRPVKIYGQQNKIQTLWQGFSFLNMKQNLQNNLMKNSKNMIRIVKQWKQNYGQFKIINIPTSFIEYFTIDDFCDKQKIQIKKFKNQILNQWIPNLVQIYKIEINELKKNMEKCQLFFDSASTLFYIQLRQLIFNALQNYQQFFQNFNFDVLNPPQTAVHLQKTIGFYEKSFITVRISHRRDQIYFMDNLDQIHKKLIQILNLLKDISQNIPRPQNLITKSSKHYISSINNDQFDFVQIKQSVSTIIKRNIQNTKKSLQIFNKYSYLLTESRRVQEWVADQKHDRREYSLTMSKYRKLYDEVMEEVPFFIRVNMIYVDSSELKRFFLNVIQQIIVRVEQSVYSLVMRKNNQIQNCLEHMIAVSSSSATSCQKLVQIQTQVQNFTRNQIRKLQIKQQDLFKWISITLYNTFYPVNEQDLAKLYETSQFLYNIKAKLDKQNIYIVDERSKLQVEIRKQSKTMNQKSNILIKQCQKLKQFGGTIVKDPALQLIKQCRNKINQYKNQKKILNHKQQLLGMDQTQLLTLLQWDKQLIPFEDLWYLVDKFMSLNHSWSRENIFKQNFQFIQSQCKSMLKTSIQLSNNPIIKNHAPLSLKMVQKLAEEIKRFQTNIPLFAVFSNVGLKQRHIKKIAYLIQYKGDISALYSLTLQKLLSMNAYQYIKDLQVINNQASRQYIVQQVILKVKSEWKTISFEMVKYKNTQINILTNNSIQSIQSKLDDHLLKILSVKGSIFSKIFETELEQLQKWLIFTSQMIQMSAKVQNSWIYLEPVMNSPDILKHLSVEGSKFFVLDDQWKKITSFYYRNQIVIQATQNKQILNNLKSCLKNIQIVKKGLNSYLESKRMSFPRFFFISDGQLLQILSQNKDCTQLQKYLKKCFEGIQKLEFEQNRYILGMYSSENEYVSFSSKINTILARGNVDEIMREIQQKMYTNIKRQINEAHSDYQTIQRKQFLFNRCQMAVSTVQLTHWTSQIEQSIVNKKINTYVNKIQQNLNEMVKLFKQINLQKVKILILEALMILSIKCLQITKNLIQINVNNLSDFQWQCQLKYYLSESEQHKDVRTCAKIFHSVIQYNHEYIGNYSRLVFTPLTDRCYRTLFLAMHYNYGGSLQGPPGTGKTQTVKDLSKALAFKCIVFNCSDGLDYKAMGKIFKGLASTGSWCCLDEFNKINLDVLSVVSQQIFSIQRAKSQERKKFFFQDIQLKLKRNTQIMITMNPDLDKKTILPYNLKSLFRTISMIVPDSKIIVEVYLFINGFKKYKQLSEKILTIYQLCSDQLSSHSYNDYSIRSVKNIIKISKELKTKNPQIQEQGLISKSISEINLPKYTKDDIFLFNGIIRDLLTQDKSLNNLNQSLVQQIKKQLNIKKYVSTEHEIQKIVQIYQMLGVRQGIILIGNSFSGKSTCLQLLQKSLNQIQNQFKVNSIKINPKSLQIHQLFGKLNSSSNDWIDGLFSTKFKYLNLQNSKQRKWLICDGSIDPIWIQNINSVLDDNKKLCLNNGEIILMKQNMTLFFESTDLIAASPAIISKCGVIYFKPQSLGYESFFQSWKMKNLELEKYGFKVINSFFQKIPNLYAEITALKTTNIIPLINLTVSFLQIFDCFIKKIKNNLKQSIRAKTSQQVSKQQNDKLFEIQISSNQKQFYSIAGSSFIFSCLWSFGVSLDSAAKKQVQFYLKRLVISDFSKTKNQKIILPQKVSLYECYFSIDQESDKLNGNWEKWIDKIKTDQSNNSIPVHQIIVKTPLASAYINIFEIILSRKIPLTIYGSTGTGKSTLLKMYSNDYFDGRNKIHTSIALSFSSTCQNLRQFIQSNLEKKGSKFILGPRNAKQLLISIDDINMPQKQIYGAQSSIQLLREILDSKGCYDLNSKQKHFRTISEVQFVFFMNSINNRISSRFLRHTFMICVSQYDEQSKINILTTILNNYFFGHSEFRNVKSILKYCFDVYEFCVKTFLPIPTKIHYNFNFKDLYQLVLSICRADKDKIHSENIGRLWSHEAKRIFKDRLIPDDKHLIDEAIDNLSKKWGKNITDTYFTNILSSSNQNSYQQVSDIQKINLSITTSLNNYNMDTQKPMDIVLFKYFLQNVLIIHRIIKKPSGHGLLIGGTGTGRSCSGVLASYISGFQTFAIENTKSFEINELIPLIKKLFLDIGVKNKQITWILHQYQLKNYQFIDWINSILKLGVISNLFSAQQKIDICQQLRNQVNQNPQVDNSLYGIYSYFENKIKDSLKLMICLSPVGEQFNKKMRRFPNLFNYTTIKWFQQWPQEGLIAVAKKVLTNIEIKHKDNFLKAVENLHVSAKRMALKYQQQTKRIVIVSPSSYIQFLNILKALLNKKRKEIKQLIFKYTKGHEKIIEAQSKIQEMKLNLEQMRPKLKLAVEQTLQKLTEVSIQKSQADMLAQNLKFEETIATQAIIQADNIKIQCQDALKIALPQLKAAEQALLVLDRNSLIELKSMNNPPPAVKLVFQGLCYLIDPNPKQKIKNEKTFKMETDWWAASQRNLTNPKLLQSLISFNKQSLTEKTINILGTFLEDPANKQILNLENVAKSSTACQCIIKWINGIYHFYFVNKSIEPKKQKLIVAEQKVKNLNQKLAIKRKEYEEANKKVNNLSYELQWAQKIKDKLQNQHYQCELYLKRAEHISISLASEKIRWLQMGEFYKKRQPKIDANVLISSAQICYLGSFTQKYRQENFSSWKSYLQKSHIQVQQNLNLITFLGSPVAIMKWNLNGLPYDNFSIENAIIMQNSKRWPLIIDPQQQASKWIKNQENSKKIKVIKTSQDNYLRNLQNCIQFGTPVLIQNLGQQINSELNPILLKKTFKKGPTTYLRIGQNQLIYSNDFMLYLTTKIRNPHYNSEICSKIAIINFMITEQGLANQLLSLIVQKQKPQLEQEKHNLLLSSAQNNRNINQLENKIIQILTSCQNILSDETTIQVLSESKSKALQIEQKQQISRKTQSNIDQTRKLYLNLAEQATILYFCVSSLININWMYQFSLNYFISLFLLLLKKNQKDQGSQNRVQTLRNQLRVFIYQIISKSLFEKDRLIFSAILTFKLQKIPQQISQFILSQNNLSNQNHDHILKKAPHEWLTDKVWNNLLQLQKFDNFSNISKDFTDIKISNQFKKFIQSPNIFSTSLPYEYQSMPLKDKLLLYKCLRPQKMKQAFTLFVKKLLGTQFIHSFNFNINQIYETSNYKTPILLILSPGSNPLSEIQRLGQQKKVNLQIISLGQGQGHIAERLIRQNLIKGGWVILQNCHLSLSWMDNLVKLLQWLQQQQKQVNKNFRIWLTSYSCKDFPLQILHRSIKVTNQNSTQINYSSLLKKRFQQIENKFQQNVTIIPKCKQLMHNICLMHGIILERKKYGSLGWNVSYDFSQNDLIISLNQIQSYFSHLTNGQSQSSIKYDILRYIIGECHYGGKIFDVNDKKLFDQLIQDSFDTKFINNQKDLYNFTITSQVLNLGKNATIMKDLNDSKYITQHLGECLCSKSILENNKYHRQEQIKKRAQQILKSNIFSIHLNQQIVIKKYPLLYEDSFNAILNQQVKKYNVLIQTIKSSLQDLIKCIQGQISMTYDTQITINSFIHNKVPSIWLNKSYPTLKSLSSYLNDLQKRISFFNNWIKNGFPQSFQLSYLYSPQSFLTTIKLNYSRLNKISIHEIQLNFIFDQSQFSNYSQQSILINGLFIEGGKWNKNKLILQDEVFGQYYSQTPIIFIKPVKLTEKTVKSQEINSKRLCQVPLYRTLVRKQVSNSILSYKNHLINIKVPTQKQDDFLLKNRLAFFLQLND